MHVAYAVRRSPKARRLTIRVTLDGRVEAVLPMRMAETHAHIFVKSRERWIERTLEKQMQRIRKSGTIRFAVGSSVPFLGDTLQIMEGTTSKRKYARREGNTLVVHGLHTGESPKHLVTAWYVKEAKKFFAREVPACAEGMEKRVGRITVRDQKTRWGSCTREGNLNFSWRLLMAPLSVARYVVIHECAHLVHLNHSKNFWSLVAHHCPDYKECIAWLKEKGLSLR